MEIEIIKTKKMLQKEMCQNKMFSCELETLQKENKSLKVKNETIMKLYKNYEEKWEKLNHNYNFFKDFYLNCLLKAFQNNLSKSFLEFFHFYFPETSLEKLYEARENLHTFIGPSKINNEQFEERLIDLEVSEVFEANPLEYENDNIDSSLLKVKYQRYLYKIAEELSFNYRIPKEDLQKVSTDHTYMMSPQQYVALPLKRRCKRSLSNTLEHIASHKKQEFNKFFMFYNQEIVEYGRFKKSMQPRNYPQTNEYFYNNNNDNNNYNNEEEGLVESQDWVEKGNTENMIGENRN